MLSRIDKLVCPTDFSTPSYEALAWAVDLAREARASLVLVHVTPVVPAIPHATMLEPGLANAPSYQEAVNKGAMAQLKEVLQERTTPDVPVFPVIRTGSPADEIVAVAREEGADAIVIATHGRTGWARMVHGSVAERTLRRAQVPVLVVPEPAARESITPNEV